MLKVKYLELNPFSGHYGYKSHNFNVIPEKVRFLSSLFINRSFNTFRSIQCEQFKVKLSEIRGWGQADRHFAAHYRLFLN
jgi:hypothetical protein